MKRSILFIILIFALYGCKFGGGNTPVFEANLDKVFLKNNEILEFDIYLERNDVGLRQPKNETGLLTGDLPKDLQPKLMYVSSVDNKELGGMCDIVIFPHRCSVTLPEYDPQKKQETSLVEVTFEDDVYAEQKVVVSYPAAISTPEILEPSKAPEQQSKFFIKFKDVEADAYEVSANLCGQDENDSTNSCLDVVHYKFVKAGDSFVLESGEEFFPAEMTVTDGVVEISSDFALAFEENIEYTVTAFLNAEKRSGIKLVTEISDFASYNR